MLKLTHKLSHIVSMLFKVKHFLPSFILKLLYHAHVHSALNYCNTIWGSTSQSHLQSLMVMQKRIIRIITDSPYLEHTRPLFKSTNILNLTDLNKFNNIMEYFLSSNHLHQGNLPAHDHFTRHRNNYVPPRTRTCLQDKSFMHLSPLYFHQLPQHLKSIISPTKFKNQLKSHFLNAY